MDVKKTDSHWVVRFDIDAQAQLLAKMEDYSNIMLNMDNREETRFQEEQKGSLLGVVLKPVEGPEGPNTYSTALAYLNEFDYKKLKEAAKFHEVKPQSQKRIDLIEALAKVKEVQALAQELSQKERDPRGPRQRKQGGRRKKKA